MNIILGMMAIFVLFYFLSRLEEKRRSLFIRNVVKLFDQKDEMQINDKTKLVLNKQRDGHLVHYELNIVIDSIIVEQQRYVEGINQNDPVAFKGPWNKDVLKTLDEEHLCLLNKHSSNIMSNLKSHNDIYTERYKQYVLSRFSIPSN